MSVKVNLTKQNSFPTTRNSQLMTERERGEKERAETEICKDRGEESTSEDTNRSISDKGIELSFNPSHEIHSIL